MAETPAVCEQLHLPLQSGSDRILARMHRGYNVDRYLSRLRLARDTIPGLVVSTDIIVGFPGETDADFAGTLQVVEEAQYDSAFMFIFSPRPGTAAAEMVDDFVDPTVVQERFERLVALQNGITRRKNELRIGEHHRILVEGPSKREPSRVTGRTRGGIPVHVSGHYPAGTFVEVEVVSAGGHHVIGRAL
jgi:tRNA-2-methylthio-N6-dimethylallyladenosine synthase